MSKKCGVSASKHLVANPARVRVIFTNSEEILCWKRRKWRRLRFPTTPAHGDDFQHHVLDGRRQWRRVVKCGFLRFFQEITVV